MKINIKNNTIELKGKVINNLDKFVLGLVEILNRHVKYVIVSGYVVIFFGRARATEDIDVLIEKKNMRKFFEEVCRKGYWLVNTNNIDDALDILNKGNAVRIARKDKIIPNIELKFTKSDLDNYSLSNRLKVIFDSKEFFFSEIEFQIAYKLLLGSEKDIEDARHLFRVFTDNLNKEKLKKHIRQLLVEKIAKKHIGEIYA